MLQGTITALITPFQGDHLDEQGFAANIQDQLNAGISGLVVLGTTGEAPTLSDRESERAIAIAVQEASGGVPVIVGTASNCTRSTIENTQRAKDLGADMALVALPYYNRPTQEGLFLHIAALARAVEIPLILYNHPGRTGVNLAPETLARMAELPTVVGLKDCSGSAAQAAQYLRAVDRHAFSFYSGDDILTLPLMALGACGVISIVSNLVPAQMVALTEAILSNRWEEAQDMHYRLMPLFEASNWETNPMPIKEMMRITGKPSGVCRLPLSPVRHETHERLVHLITELLAEVRS